jgi:polysaccharide biosynthesis transport protein
MDADTTLAADTRELGGMLRRQWLVILLCTALGVGAAVLAMRLPEPLYRASTKVVVGQEGSLFNPEVESGSVADSFTQTVADLVTSDVVAREAIGRAGVSTSSRKLRDRLQVTVKPSTTAITISYDAPSRATAVRTLSAVSASFADILEDRFASDGAEALTVTVFDPAHFEEQVRPKPVRDVAVGVIAGLMLGLVIGFLRDSARGGVDWE